MSASPIIAITAQPGCDLYDHEIDWQPFAGIEHLELTLCDLDEERHVFDLIVRFAPNKIVTMHNHLAQTNMLILQGELRMYEPDGSIREARPAGRYYRGRKYRTPPTPTQEYFRLAPGDSRAVAARERHGTLFAAATRKLAL